MTQLSTHKIQFLSPPGFVRLLVLCTICALICTAQASAEIGSPPPVSATLGDPQELETFVDGVVTTQLEELHIAGAEVVIVKDGQVLGSQEVG